MSSLNPFKAVKKVFKSIKKVVSKVWEAVKPIVKPLLIAAAIYFTAGTAMAYFAAPSAGLGAAMSSTATSMWSGITGMFGANAVPAAGTQLASGAAATGAGPTLAAADALGQGAQLANFAGTAAPVVTESAASTGGLISSALKGVGTFIKDNGALVTLAGSGMANMAAGQAKRDEAEAELEYKKSLGIGGADWYGNTTFKPRTDEDIAKMAADPSKQSIISQPSAIILPQMTQTAQMQAPTTTQILTPAELAAKLNGTA